MGHIYIYIYMYIYHKPSSHIVYLAVHKCMGICVFVCLCVLTCIDLTCMDQWILCVLMSVYLLKELRIHPTFHTQMYQNLWSKSHLRFINDTPVSLSSGGK